MPPTPPSNRKAIMATVKVEPDCEDCERERFREENEDVPYHLHVNGNPQFNSDGSPQMVTRSYTIGSRKVDPNCEDCERITYEKEHVPSYWSDDEQELTAAIPYLWKSYRHRLAEPVEMDVWGDFSTPKPILMFMAQ